jgi:hypothetical protein
MAYAAIISILVLFGLGPFASSGLSTRRVFLVFHGAVRWLSPLNYWLISVQAASAGRWMIFLLGLALQLVLAGLYLAATELAVRVRGRRE